MKFNSPIAWPHPVLSPLTNDIASADFDFELEVSAQHPNWRLKVTSSLSDPTMKALLESGRASYFLHVECRGTFYRGNFSSQKPEFEVEISSALLRGTTEASFLLVASSDFSDYKHPEQHADYGSSTFSIRTGEPLGVAISKTFDAFLDVDPILNLPSIIDIAQGEADLMQVFFEGDRILIKLREADFKEYKMMSGNVTIRGLLSTSVILPTLIQAMHFLAQLGEDELEEFKFSHRWARVILPRLEKINISVERLKENNVCLEAAQQLLQGPVCRSLVNIKSLFS